MSSINWKNEVEKRKADLISETQKFLQIPSVLDEFSAGLGQPFGTDINEALKFLLKIGEECDFRVKNLEGYAGYIEFGHGEESVGILCHIDVVPEGEGWTSPPYAAEIIDGKLIARGAIDDKGPTMAAFYAMKIVKDLGLPLSKRVRMIIGTDEESTWQCVDHYFKHEEMPTVGFAPDADFPIIYAEKGICDIQLKTTWNGMEDQSLPLLVSFQSGRRMNMVPDQATATIQVKQEDILRMKTDFHLFLRNNNLEGHITEENEKLILHMKGKSAHGMEPKLGVNAGLYLAEFLNGILVKGGGGKQFIQLTAEYLHNKSRGTQLGIAFTDDITGDLTVNCGLLSYERESGGSIGLNIRYPVTNDGEKMINILQSFAENKDFLLTVLDHSPPHHVDKEHSLIQVLSRVYEEQTGEKAELLSIGGGTYARSLEAGVAFGPLFPGREDVAHQKDEYIMIDDLLKATAIYAQAIYELAKE
ncbi:dipeptidase PepV [Alkalihalobacterium chitinilyticum]|uniref:Dipeptidase PepV n=1 Tax=Alkalihalobacterium chitinilyticum TaxID=2980103 RepID=A0ABT5VJR5_9BACI|nr:dipeptidase PepV [Alkalihalobacterium chitinilyticum]MDE5415659.1 dipeptidase PepV [Alkalihalobacterium chitinilyticum]